MASDLVIATVPDEKIYRVVTSRWSFTPFTPMINQFSFTKLNPNDIGLIHSFHSWRKCTINQEQD